VSDGISNTLLLEEIANDLRLSLAAAQMTAHGSHQLVAVAGTALPQAIGLDALIEQFIGVELRAVPRQPSRNR
jgi:hypothetical protein